MEVKYFEVDGTFFKEGTKDEIVRIINSCIQNRRRIILDYGHDDGQSWGETFDTRGYIGRSTGVFQIPILVYNSRSTGGGSILTHCIVQIKESKGGKILYQHPNYKPWKPFI